MRSLALPVSLLAACVACKKSDPPAQPDASAPVPGAPGVVAEPLPRCRADGRDLPIPGEDVIAGDAVTLDGALVLGVVRRDGAKRVASVVRAPLDLASVKAIDLGPALGDDPPPVPYVRGADVIAALYARKKDSEGGGADKGTRELRLVRLDGSTVGSVAQQADESAAFDVAWPADGPPLVAWDEDAPIPSGQFLADRGTVKVQLLGSSDKPRAVSPYATDAEQPKLLARTGAGGGYWLAWIARRGEAEADSGTYAPEGPGERRDRRWVELAALDARGELSGPIRRVSPERGRVVSFELAVASGGAELVVLAQDEVAAGEGAGARIVRYVVSADRSDPVELVDGGLGHAIATVTPPSAPRWLSWTDGAERAHLVPLGPALSVQAAATTERALDRARLVAATADALYAVASDATQSGGRLVLRRLTCR